MTAAAGYEPLAHGPLFCERCGEPLQGGKYRALVTWLHLSNTTGRYHANEALPAGEDSQGWFPFGQACARAVLRNGGDCQPPRGRRR